MIWLILNDASTVKSVLPRAPALLLPINSRPPDRHGGKLPAEAAVLQPGKKLHPRNRPNGPLPRKAPENLPQPAGAQLRRRAGEVRQRRKDRLPGKPNGP